MKIYKPLPVKVKICQLCKTNPATLNYQGQFVCAACYNEHYEDSPYLHYVPGGKINEDEK